uniref:Uncharacterized protein n=1 Tax=Corethron hystrix TaxID=216773 RepID=A0A7S1BW25_9STRA
MDVTRMLESVAAIRRGEGVATNAAQGEGKRYRRPTAAREAKGFESCGHRCIDIFLLFTMCSLWCGPHGAVRCGPVWGASTDLRTQFHPTKNLKHWTSFHTKN